MIEDMNSETPDSQNDTPLDLRIEHASTEDKPTANKATKIVITSIVVLVTIVVFTIVWFIISFSGGLNGAISSFKQPPDTNSSSFMDKKNLAKSSIEDSYTSLGRLTALKLYGSSSVDGCEQGQNNYKVHDGYAYRCTYRTSKFYGINDNFRQKLLDFEQNILKDGWSDSGSPECEHCTISDVIYNYFDNQEQNTNALYLPPEPARYTKNDQNLDIMFGHEALARDDSFGYYILGPDNHYQQDFRDGLVATLKENRYVLVISIQQIFFEN